MVDGRSQRRPQKRPEVEGYLRTKVDLCSEVPGVGVGDRSALTRRRCLMLVDGCWLLDDRGGQKAKNKRSPKR